MNKPEEKKAYSQFTGNVQTGNPYKGDINRGIDYDLFEANTHYLDRDGKVPFLSHPYRAGNRAMMKHLEARIGQRVLDTGSGTGISTLELAAQNQGIIIQGIEISEGMCNIARFKFGHNDWKEVHESIENRAGINPPKDYQALLNYWKEFRNEAAPHKERVNFINGDLKNLDQFPNEAFDHATGYCVPHWMGKGDELVKFFTDISRILKPKGTYVWATAAHWFDDGSYPRRERWFLFNEFIQGYLEEARKISGKQFDAYAPPTPQHDMESISEITSKAGMRTEKAGMFYHDYDLQTIMMNHCAGIARDKLQNKLPAADIERVIIEARAQTVKNPAAMSDTQHKIQFVPIFRTTKQ